MASKQTIISPYVNINEINPALDHYKIRVRVIRLWKAFKSLQMVLVDDEGTRIHASIEDALVKKFHNQINIGDSKIIDTFSLVDYDDVVGQIAGVGSLDNIKIKGKDNVKITFDLQDLRYLVHNEENIQPKVTLYEEFFMKNEKKTIDVILYSLEVRTCVTIGTICSVETVPKWYYIACKECRKKDDQNIMPVCLSALIGKTMLFKISVTIDNLKSDKASYVVEKFWENEDMVNQFVKETYRKANDNYQELESDDQILGLTSEESTSLSSKRELSGINEEVVQGHSMTTRKRIKIEKQT
ncbi:PREDICTED: uncharacterized protein LOC104734068 [Camelina sativa]|uniref:Uncharacterized protein LOC104734068 n=1 Tax=Camelina sativa TaxID=90675 RepID=A0ABM1QR80_CAMSA|nr:PREDICTED: uncharacterized protein LOC104734068 [Camelina sativa]